MRRSGGGGGDPRRRSSGRSTGGSRGGIDWVADEHGQVQRPSEHSEAQERKRTAECLPHKTEYSHKRRHTWSQEEDAILIQMVNLHGSSNWSTIARAIPGRIPNQCRERWMFYLDPSVNNQPWSKQEDMKLIQAQQIHGNQWCRLAKLFPGRTGKAIKNRWHGLMRKKMKSDLVRGLPEQYPYMPNDALVGKNKGSRPLKSVQDSSTNFQDSTDWPTRPKLEQGLNKDLSNASTTNGKVPDSIRGQGSAAHSVNASERVDGEISRCNLPAVTEEKMVFSSSSVHRKVCFVAAGIPTPLQKEESTDVLQGPSRSAGTGFSPARNSNNDADANSDEICSSADPESLANIGDLLDMSYCESLMIVAPDSPNDANPMLGM